MPELVFKTPDFPTGATTKLKVAECSRCAAPTARQSVRHMCKELTQLRQATEAELQHSVLDNYTAFIRCGRPGRLSLPCACCGTSPPPAADRA